MQKSICKHGFPKGNVFEYAALQISKFEKKQKAEKSKKLEFIKSSKELRGKYCICNMFNNMNFVDLPMVYTIFYLI